MTAFPWAWEELRQLETIAPPQPVPRKWRRLIPRSDTEVGFAHPRPPYICRDRVGYWRKAHEYMGRERCIFCDKRRPKE